MDTSLRFIGFCPVCQRRIKVRDGRLVHHGYERPGEGYIVGDCFAVDMPPHELSPVAAEDYLRAVVRPAVRKAEHEVEYLRLDPEWMLFEKYDPDAADAARARGERIRGNNVTKKLTRDEVAEYEWDGKLRGLRDQAQRHLDAMLAVQRRMQKLIDTGQREPLETVEEEVAKQEQSRAERAAILAAKREEKAAHRRALDAKTAERESQRAAIIAAFRQEFAALAEQEPGPERNSALDRLLAEFRKKKYSFIMLWDLRADDALRHLGLLEEVPVGGSGISRSYSTRLWRD